MRRPLIAATLLLLAPVVISPGAIAQQVYKWTDASGSVHYSDTPPPKGNTSKKITLTGIAQSSGAEPAKSESAPGSEQASGKPEPTPQKPVADTPENRKKLCGTLKGNLEILRDKKPVVVQEGNQAKVLDDSQRKQQQSTAEAQYKQYCPNE